MLQASFAVMMVPVSPVLRSYSGPDRDTASTGRYFMAPAEDVEADLSIFFRKNKRQVGKTDLVGTQAREVDDAVKVMR